MRQAINDVTQFHEVMGQPVYTTVTRPSDARVHLRTSLVFEECCEILKAVYPDLEVRSDEGVTVIYWGEQVEVNIIELADGLADLIYVVVGTALEFGIPLEAVWNEVHRSNMAKVGPDGVVKYREDGKILKPSSWTPPDIAGVLSEVF